MSESTTRPLIDGEFAALIPPLQPDELAQLEANIIADGCRDPLVVWRGTLLDGHNRLAICEHHGLPYQTVAIDLPDRAAALDWILANQLGRRNLTRDQFTVLLGRRYAAQKTVGHGARTGYQNDTQRTRDRIAQEHGVSSATVSRAAAIIAELPEPVVDAVARGETTLLQAKREQKEARREERRQENHAKVAAAPNPTESGARFATIVVDPPWDWGDEGDADQLGRARPTYGTMPYPDLLQLPLADLADVDCHLYLWITNRSLPKGFGLLEAWGFRYVTCLTWCKPSFGMGNYFRGQTEHVLFGVRGSQPLKRRDVGTCFTADRGPLGHSSKPVEFAALVESCSPGPYLEMFARSGRDGWTSWGAEA